jgi:hypothetical protein
MRKRFAVTVTPSSRPDVLRRHFTRGACVVIFVWTILGTVLFASTPAAGRRVRPRRYVKPRINRKFHRPAPKTFTDRRCLRFLRLLKIRHRRLKNVRGVATPIEVLGNRIGRIRYRQIYNKGRMVMDCRLAVALQRVSPLLHVNGVREIRYSNFHSWRRVEHAKRLSRHALGLAIDIHGFRNLKGHRVTVQKHYEKKLGKGRTCEGWAQTWQARMLRDIACDLDASNMFDRILTPDYDAGHADHFHVSTFHPLDKKRVRIYRTVLVEVRGLLYPWAQKRPRRARYRRSLIAGLVKWRGRKLRRWYKWRARQKKRARKGK